MFKLHLLAFHWSSQCVMVNYIDSSSEWPPSFVDVSEGGHQ